MSAQPAGDRQARSSSFSALQMSDVVDKKNLDLEQEQAEVDPKSE
jgi:hypothetical protein